VGSLSPRPPPVALPGLAALPIDPHGPLAVYRIGPHLVGVDDGDEHEEQSEHDEDEKEDPPGTLATGRVHMLATIGQRSG